MNTKNILIIVAVVAVVGAFLYAFTAGLISFDKKYSNDAYGISFQYPNRYDLQERAVDSGHHNLTLIQKKDLPVPQNGEGPTAITVDVYRYLGGMGAENWVRTSPSSNFQLSPDGQLDVAEQGGAEVVTYSWDGLYRGDSLVFVHAGNIVMLSVTYLTPEDQIRDDFAKLLETLKLTAVEAE